MYFMYSFWYFLILTVHGALRWQSCPDFQTGRVVLFQQLANSKTNISNYYITHDQISNGPLRYGISITGFDIKQSNDIWIDTLIESANSSGMVINISIRYETIAYILKVDYINFKARDYIDIISESFQTSVMNSGSGFRKQIRILNSTINFQLIQVAIFLQSLSISNHNKSNFYIKSHASVNNGFIICQFQIVQTMRVYNIYYWVFLFDKMTAEKYSDFFVNIKNFRCQSIFNKRAQFNLPRFQGANRRMFGMNEFYFIRSAQTSLIFQLDTTQTNISENYFFSNSLNFIQITVIKVVCRFCDINQFFYHNQSRPQNDQCTSSCPVQKRFEVQDHQICQGCSYSCEQCWDQNSSVCTACSASMYRFQDNWITINSTPNFQGGSCNCKSQYLDVAEPVCKICTDLIAGCQICTSTTICNTCKSTFTLNSTSKLCECTKEMEFIVSGICVNISGCLAAFADSSSNQFFCTSCNKTNHFELVNYTCSCLTGYILKLIGVSYQSNLCEPICGDGNKLDEQQCDDQNKIDGDGCSSVCSIQANYICQNIEGTTKSLCRQSIIFDLTLKSMIRNIAQNQVQIIVEIAPYNSKLENINLEKLIQVTIPHKKTLVTYISPHIDITIDYNESIQLKHYELWINLNQTLLFANQSVKLSFIAQGSNCQLSYNANIELQTIFGYIMIALIVLTYIATLFSVVVERWIGLQLIQTYQLSFFTMITLQSIPLQLTPFSTRLAYSKGFSLIQYDYFRVSGLPKQLIGLGLEKQFLLNLNIFYIIIVIGLLSVLIIFIVYRKQKLGDTFDPTYTKRIQVLEKVIKIMVNRFYILITILNMLEVIICFHLQVANHQTRFSLLNNEINIFAAIAAYLIILITICYVCFEYIIKIPYDPENNINYKKTFESLEFHDMVDYYPLIFLIQRGLIITLMAIFYLNLYSNYIIISIHVVYIIIIIVIRPHKGQLAWLHNISIIVYEITSLFMCFICLYWNVVADHIATQQPVIQYMAYFMFFLLFLSTVLSFVRIIDKLRRQVYFQKPQQSQYEESMKFFTNIEVAKQKEQMQKFKKKQFSVSKDSNREILDVEIKEQSQPDQRNQIRKELKRNNFLTFKSQQEQQQKINYIQKIPKKNKNIHLNYIIPIANNSKSAMKKLTLMDKMQEKLRNQKNK